MRPLPTIRRLLEYLLVCGTVAIALPGLRAIHGAAWRKIAHATQVAWAPTVQVTANTFFYLRIVGYDVRGDELPHRYQVTVSAPIWIRTP